MFLFLWSFEALLCYGMTVFLNYHQLSAENALLARMLGYAAFVGLRALSYLIKPVEYIIRKALIVSTY